MQFLTVVYTINDPAAFEETRKSIIDSMSASEGKPFSVTVVSCDHEMRRLDLIEQALDAGDMAAADKAISSANIGNIKNLDELMER
ncbi:hypothetical protein [Nitrosomonas sp.]|uniref:hypothetical protein n=1 Tax=Nitrosomonas sp. TaxID=42353 RepID=UPI0025F9942E|nr:hypothetical protein [Nitrosomonas sp.]